MKVTDLMIKITADAATFKAATQSATRASQQMAERVSKNMRKVGAAMSAAVTLPLTLLAKSSLKAADVQAKAEAKVQQALIQTGNAAGYTLDQLKQLASQTQSKTLFGDEEILGGVTAKLLSFTNIAGENFQRLQGLVLDFATQMKTDASTAAVTLGKALDNPIKATSQLMRVGITFTDQEKKKIKALTETGRVAEAQAIILDKLNAKFGGQAEAAARTGAGAIKQMQNAWGDLKETIGTVLMPYVVSLANRLKVLFERFQNLSPATKKLIVVIGALVAGIGPLLMTLGSVSLALPAIRTGISAITGVLPALKMALTALAGPLGIILALVTAVTVAYRNMKKAKNQWKEDFSNELSGMTEDELRGERERLSKMINTFENDPNMQRKSKWNKVLATASDYAVNGPLHYEENWRDMYKVKSATGETYTQKEIDRMYEKLDSVNKELSKRQAETYKAEKEAEDEKAKILAEVNDALNLENENLDNQNNNLEKTGGILGDLKNQVSELEKKKLLPGTTEEDIARYNTEIQNLQKQIDRLSSLTVADLTAMNTPIERVAAAFKQVGVSVQEASQKISSANLQPDKNQKLKGDWMVEMIQGGSSPEEASARINDWMQRYRKVFGANIEQLKKFTEEKLQEWQNTLGRFVDSTVVGLFESIGKSIVGGNLFGNLFSFIGSQLGNLLISLGSILIATSEAMIAFKEALASLFSNPVSGIIAGAAMIIAGSALIALANKKAQKATSTVALAQGGLAYGPTLAMVGDNMNAASDPEVIAPLSKLRDYAGIGSQTIDLHISGEFRSKGRDLVATLSNENARYRTMGI